MKKSFSGTQNPQMAVSNMVIDAKRVGAWICKGREYAAQAEKLSDGNPSVAMAYYLVASTHLEHAASVLRSSETDQSRALCRLVNMGGDKSSLLCLQDECTRVTHMRETLEATCRDYAARAGVAGDHFCRLQDALVRDASTAAATPGINSGNRDEAGAEEAVVTCSCGLRAQIEHNLEAGSEHCREAWFDRIVGQAAAKEALTNGFQMPLIYPSLFQRGSRAVLLYGPPGTGKTMLARAVANELTASTIIPKTSLPRVRLLMLAPQHSDIKSKFVGEAERKISQIFRCASEFATSAQQLARQDPQNQNARVLAVVFLDEVEVLAKDRTQDKTGFGGATLNTLLQEMDGIKSHDNVVVIAATNYPWQLDAAFLRRFTQSVYVGLPSTEDIQRLLELQISRTLTTISRRWLSRDADDEIHAVGNGQMKAGKNGAQICERELNAPCARGNLVDDGPTAYVHGPFKDFVKINDKELSDLAGILSTEQYSPSDISNLMTVAGQRLGQEAVKNGTFCRFGAADFFGAQQIPASEYIYISTLCVPPNHTGLPVFRLPQSQNSEEPDHIQIGARTYTHISRTRLNVPGHDEGYAIVGNSVYVADEQDDQLIYVAVQITRTTLAAAVKNATTNANVLAWHAGAREPYTWEHVKNSNLQNSTTPGSVALKQVLWVVVGLQRSSDWNITKRVTNFFQKVWRHTPDQSSDPENALDKLQVRFNKDNSRLYNLLATKDGTNVSIYTTWGQEDEQTLKLVYEKTLVVPVDDMELVFSDSESALELLNDLGNSKNTMTPNKFKLNTSPWGQAHTKSVTFYTKDVKSKNNKNIEDLPLGVEDRLVHCGFNMDVFREAHNVVKSSADSEMIQVLEAYSKNPTKVMTCMAKEARPKIDPKCLKV
jgi:SpoVK/Ycf46/Vps4 family AAA+-type ATPase